MPKNQCLSDHQDWQPKNYQSLWKQVQILHSFKPDRVLALREESGHEVPSLTISVFSINEILNETYALPMVNHARATCIWQFYSTCLYWVSGSTLMRMTDMVSSSRGQSLCLQNVEWVRFWKVLLITWHGPFPLDHSCMDL